MDPTRFDEFFFTIAKETGGIEGLFSSLFSFLFRRTDYFYESNPGDKMGFPPGVAAKMLNSIFQKYQEEHYKRIPKKDPKEYQSKLKEFNDKKEKEKEKVVQNKPENNESNKESSDNQKIHKELQEQKEDNEEKNTQKSENKDESLPNQKSIDISTYNGGSTNKYLWSQNINDVTVQINLPRKVRAKEVKVDFKAKHINIILAGETILDGDLDERIKPEESIWSIEDETKLILTLEKGSENIWKTIFKGDEEIDTKKVDNSKPLQDFDPETQVYFNKLGCIEENNVRATKEESRSSNNR